jgi:hypothetical protein
VLLLVLPLLVTGCALFVFAGGAAAGGGALLWSRGWLEESLSEPIERVHRAAKTVFRDSRVALEEDELKDGKGNLEGDLPDGRHIQVRTKALPTKGTRVRIRVGFWGDQGASLHMLDQIKKNL